METKPPRQRVLHRVHNHRARAQIDQPRTPITAEPSPRDHGSSAGFPACAVIFEQPHRSRRFCPPSPHHPLPPSTPLISQSSREETVVRKLTPLFGLMGKVNYMGGSGKGQFAK
ncbi:hypothetical protein M0R45_017131 [Rubus argutus]|uniref:Uncharacterized protein n=1 Tax=Rubus argutus TaxID=59490 RepID=A0AAW1XX39_RUBAR